MEGVVFYFLVKTQCNNLNKLHHNERFNYLLFTHIFDRVKKINNFNYCN